MRGRRRSSRVLLVMHAATVGGMEAVTVTLTGELVRRGVEVRVTLPRQPLFDDIAARYSRAGARVHRLEATWQRGRIVQCLGLLRLAVMIARWRPGVVHLHTSSESGGSAVALIAWLRGVPIVVTEHTLWPRQRSWRERASRSLLHRVARLFVSVSRFNAGRSIHRATRPGKMAVVLNGIAPLTRDRDAMRRATLASLHIGGGEVVIGVAARFVAEKRIAALVEAAAPLVRAGEAMLLIVGDGPDRGLIEACVDALGLRERTMFTGFVDDAIPFIAAMDILVLAQAEGTMSISVLEAMQLGCATVIGYGEDEEPVVHRETGLRVPGAEVPDLQAALTELVRDAGLRKRLALAGTLHVAAQFSGARMADDHLALYRAAVRREPIPDWLRP